MSSTKPPLNQVDLLVGEPCGDIEQVTIEMFSTVTLLIGPVVGSSFQHTHTVEIKKVAFEPMSLLLSLDKQPVLRSQIKNWKRVLGGHMSTLKPYKLLAPDAVIFRRVYTENLAKSKSAVFIRKAGACHCA